MEQGLTFSWWMWACLVFVLVFFVTCAIVKLHELGVRPLREVSRLLHRPWFEISLLLFMVGGIVQYGATKGTNGTDRSELMGLMRNPAPVIIPTATDLTGLTISTNFPAITNLCFWGIEHGDETVSLGIAWPPTMSFTNDCIDIFGCDRLTSNGWWRLARLDVSQIVSNAIVEFAYADLPTSAMCVSAFYRLASQDDSDGDGLTDKVEEWVLGTDPFSSDTDNDGLSDASEVDFEVDPRSEDSDLDGLSDGDEVGYIQVADCFVWHDTSALSPTYNTGYWYEEMGMGTGISSWWCQVTSRPIYSAHNVVGLPLSYLTAFETGYIAFSSVGDYNGWIFPPGPTALNRDVYNSGSILVAAYWNESYLYKGDTNSYIKAGTVSDGTYVVEFHDVRTAPYSTMGMTYQVTIPSGTGNVIRVSYLSSDCWMDGEGAVVGVQNKRIVTTNGYYNLTWNFSERGPVLLRTTIEYHLGYGTNPVSRDTDGDGLNDIFEIMVSHSDPLSADGDRDGLTDVQEYAIGTNPKAADSDGDDLSDKWEHDNGLNPLLATGSDGGSGDPDGDGLNNRREKSLGTHPNNADSDVDGVDDGIEISIGTNPLLQDTDGDGLTDGEEFYQIRSNPLSNDSDEDGLLDADEVDRGTSPINNDSDDDGLKDGYEVLWGLNPLSGSDNEGGAADIDRDGLTNLQEQAAGSNPLDSDSDDDGLNDGLEVSIGTSPLLSDSDYDGLSDSQERAIGTNPTQPDTDGDGMNDGWEWTFSDLLLAAGHDNSIATFNPLVHNSNDSDPDNDYSADPDGDDLTNGQESDMGTNPNVDDTDGDGANDGAEVAQSSDPNDAADSGVAHSRVNVSFYFGDHSGSHSEKYCLRLTPIAGSGIGTTPRTLSYVNANYGECETKTVVLVPGWKYEITLGHAGTNLAEGPDYDYTLTTTGNIPSNVIIEDSNSLFGMDETSATFAGANKCAAISIYAISQVAVCAPDDSSWPVLEEGRVLFDYENLRIKVAVTPKLTMPDMVRQMFGDALIVKTSGTCPSGVTVPIGDDALIDNSSDKSEIRITKTRQQLISLGLLPSQDEDGVDEMAWLDMASGTGQSLADSEAFAGLGYADRGTASKMDPMRTLDSMPPNSMPSESYFKAAGREIVTAAYGGMTSGRRQLMNQADVFYFSGHGNHDGNSIQGGFTPSMAHEYWNRDLNIAIIAGCSVLDINDYNGNYSGASHMHSPGEEWERTGPDILLGYAFIAPGDAGGAPTRIVNQWCANRAASGDVNAWMDANAANHAWNACAIVKGQKYVYFKKVFFKKFKKLQEVSKGEW